MDIETGEFKSLRDELGGGLLTGQVVSGVKAARARSAALAWNVGRPVPMLMSAGWLASRGSAPYGGNRRR